MGKKKNKKEKQNNNNRPKMDECNNNIANRRGGCE